MSEPCFSGVIPTLNRVDDLKRCLDSLAAQTVPLDEVRVIDNGSTDGTRELLQRNAVEVITEPNVPLSRLFNVGWRATQAEYVAFLNDDSEAVPGWLESVKKTFAEFPDAAAVGGPTIAMREQEIFRTYQMLLRSGWTRWLAHLYNRFIHEGKLLQVGEYSESGAYSIGGSLRECLSAAQPFPVRLLSITNLVIRRSVLERLGGFDEGFRYAHIDGDLFLRMGEAGLVLVFDPHAVVWHYVNPSGLTRSAYVLSRDLAHLYRKHLPPRSPLGWLRFAANVTFVNLFWIYKAVALRRLKPLSGITGFLAGAIGR
ncbi:MAG: glycosyltransferase family 2 protein [Chloroflexi bacterium]|nr:glycosyltransferase family 2 protein [Chloroflexota bacterium]